MVRQRSSAYRLERSSANDSWRQRPADFVRFRRESMAEAVDRDSRELIARYRELPTIERYAEAVNPRYEPDAARIALLAAFDAAPAWVDVLAEAWRARYPAWSDAIDLAVGISSMGVGPDVMDRLGHRIGPAAFDDLGRYELLERFGRGASGMVFRAIDHVFVACGESGEVAVKLVPCAASEVASALREAGIARRVSHGGIARTLDAGRLDSTLAEELGLGEQGIFIVQEFIYGQPLWVWKACHPERNARSCLVIMARVREALDACHEAGVLHGDLNPANVLIEAGDRTRIIDFGRSDPDGPKGDRKSCENDLKRLDAMRRWLLRDLREVHDARGGWHGSFATAALAGFAILAGALQPEAIGRRSTIPARDATNRLAPGLPAPDASAREYQLFKQDGRVILIPGGISGAGASPPGNVVGSKGDPSIESVTILDPQMVTIKISDEEFPRLVGKSTGETSPDGLAMYRVSKEQWRGALANAGRSGTVAVSPIVGPKPQTTSVASDAMLRELFGETLFAEGQEERRSLAREILADGPVPETERSQRLALAERIGVEADRLRREGTPDSGLETLAAAGFLSAEANAHAIRYSLQACNPECPGVRRALAATVQAIASWRTGAASVGVDASMLNRLAERIGGPGLKRFDWGP